MATVLQPIVNELNIVLVHLRTELRGLQTDADGASIASTTDTQQRTPCHITGAIACAHQSSDSVHAATLALTVWVSSALFLPRQQHLHW